MNTTKTVVLMVGLTVLLVLIGGAFGGRQGMIMAFMFASVMNMFSYWFSDKIVLRMYGAKEVSEADAPVLYSVTRDIAMKMNMPMPKVYIIPSDAPNAFATGRNPESRGGCGNRRHSPAADERGIVGRDGARAGSRSESRHPDRNDRGDDCGRHQHAGATWPSGQ